MKGSLKLRANFLALLLLALPVQAADGGEALLVSEAALRLTSGEVVTRDGGVWLSDEASADYERRLVNLETQNATLKADPPTPAWAYVGAILLGVALGVGVTVALK